MKKFEFKSMKVFFSNSESSCYKISLLDEMLCQKKKKLRNPLIKQRLHVFVRGFIWSWEA